MIQIQTPHHGKSIVLLLLGLILSALAGWGLIASPSAIIVIAPFAIVIGGILAFRLPGGVFAAYLYIPFYKGVVDPYLPVDLTVLLAAACLSLSIPLLLEKWNASLIRLVVLWTALLGTIALGTLHALDSNLALTQLMYFALLVYLPSFLGVRVVRDQRLLNQFIGATAVLAIIVSVTGVIQLGGLGVYDRVAAMSNTIGTARSALLLVLVLPALFSFRIPWFWLVSIFATPLALFVAVASGSRGPLVMGAVTVVVVQLLAKQKVGGKKVFGAIILFATVYLFQLPQIQSLLPAQSVGRIQTLVDAAMGTGELDNSSMARIELFEIAGQMFSTMPMFGYGTAGFEAFGRINFGSEYHAYPHNLVLQIAAEFGVTGLVVVLGFIIAAFINGASNLHDPRFQAVFALALFALLNAMVSNGIYDNRWMWGMVLMLLAIQPSSANRYPHEKRGS